MEEWVIYYNPKCGTCRNTLELLKSKKINPRIVEYLKTPLNAKQITALLKKLQLEPLSVMRAKEPIFEELALGRKGLSEEKLIQAIVDHPVLLQRPIVENGSRAVIARPPENVEELFD